MFPYSTIAAFRSASIAFSQVTFAERTTTLKEQWAEEHEAWSKRNLSDKLYVYVWPHAIYPKVRLEDDANQKQCMLVLIGVTPEGKKELIAALDGYRESKQSWRELKNRGLQVDPTLTIGDGALGFWAAVREVFAGTREQRCWVHETANNLKKMPKSVQPKAKSDIHEIWQGKTKNKAIEAFDLFECLSMNREACERLTTSPRSTGATCEQPIQSNPPSQRLDFVIARRKC